MTKVVTNHPEGDVNIWSKIQGKSGTDISLKNTKVNLRARDNNINTNNNTFYLNSVFKAVKDIKIIWIPDMRAMKVCIKCAVKYTKSLSFK